MRGDDDLQAFERLLDRRGPDTEAWPPGARELARRSLAGDARAGELLREARQLDRLLRGSLPAEVPPALQARLASIPAMHSGSRRSSWWPVPQLAWGAGTTALAAAAILGIVVGASGSLPATFDEDTVDLAALAFGPQLEPGDEP